VRDEIENGMGKQFDSEFASIMLRLIDTGEADALISTTRV
jgi:hypothetical protein